jgi:hypothetical protein
MMTDKARLSQLIDIEYELRNKRLRIVGNKFSKERDKKLEMLKKTNKALGIMNDPFVLIIFMVLTVLSITIDGSDSGMPFEEQVFLMYAIMMTVIPIILDLIENHIWDVYYKQEQKARNLF